MNNKIEVKTQFGTLCAKIGEDPQNHPEISVYLHKDNGVEIDLCAVGAAKDSKELNAYLYTNIRTDDELINTQWSQEEFDFEE